MLIGRTNLSQPREGRGTIRAAEFGLVQQASPWNAAAGQPFVRHIGCRDTIHLPTLPSIVLQSLSVRG